MAVVAIIGSQGIPAQYGGFEVLAENLAKHLAKKHELIVYCSGPAYKQRRNSYLGAKLEYIPLGANGAQSIPYDVWSMLKAVRQADILLILGVSGCLFLPLIKLFSKKPIIVNLDGIDWKRAKWNWLARNFLRISEKVAARFADELIADNAAIQDYILETYGKSSHLIEYGGDNAIVDLPVREGSEVNIVTLKKVNSKAAPAEAIRFDNYAFSVCRIEPENNIHMLLEAFADQSALPLVIVGNWEASEYGQKLRSEYGKQPNIQLLDPIWDSGKLFDIRSNATLYIHGHSVGGTNPSLVEAMCLGLPVIAYDVIFNRATTHGEAIYFTDAMDLVTKLAAITKPEIAALAARMLKIGRDKYAWNIISDKYAKMFDSDSPGKRVVHQTRHENRIDNGKFGREGDIQRTDALRRSNSPIDRH